MEPVHGRLHRVFAGALRRGAHALGLRRIQRQRLLAEHVLARLERADGPRLVVAVDERDVDRVDLRVVEKRIVRGGRARSVESIRHLPRALRVAARDRPPAALAGGGDRRKHRSTRDASGAKRAPPYAIPYMSTSTCAPPRAIECVAASITATVRRAFAGVTASAPSHATRSARFL